MKSASVGWCQPSDKEILADYSSCVLRGYKKWIFLIFITLWKCHLFMPYKNYLINFHLKSIITWPFLFSAECFCLSEFILIITKNPMTHNRIHIVPHNVLLCVQFGDVWFWMGLLIESHLGWLGHEEYEQKAGGISSFPTRSAFFPCLQTLSCSFILSFPWWLFCLGFCCKKQINRWNCVVLNVAWQCSSAGARGMLGRGRWVLPMLTAPLGNGVWNWEVHASKCSCSSYFGLKNLVWVGNQPHSCCTDFCAVLMSVN